MDLPYDRPYFFDNGLRFTCTGCGDCCRQTPGTVFAAPQEIGPMAALLNMGEEAFVERYTSPANGGFLIGETDKGCCLLEGDRCRVYAARPAQCRTFPFWLSNVRSAYAWKNGTSFCPGVGRGELYSREKILSRIAADF